MGVRADASPSRGPAYLPTSACLPPPLPCLAPQVMMFLHIAPESSSYSESVSTLKFGSRVSEITLGRVGGGGGHARGRLVEEGGQRQGGWELLLLLLLCVLVRGGEQQNPCAS